MKRIHIGLLATLALAACSGDRGEAAAKPADTPIQSTAADGGDADLPPVQERALTPEELERGRNSNEWTSVVQLDTTGAGSAVRNPEKWEQISTEQMNTGAAFLPLGGDVGGPSVYRVQILLDRALFSPGMMDGRWGKNTAKAVYFFQQREGLRTTGRVDSTTYARLVEAAGRPEQLVVVPAPGTGQVLYGGYDDLSPAPMPSELDGVAIVDRLPDAQGDVVQLLDGDGQPMTMPRAAGGGPDGQITVQNLLCGVKGCG